MDNIISNKNNDKNIIIIMNGFIKSGKTTIQKYLCERYGFISINFADILKDIVSIVFGFPRELLEGDTIQSREWREKVDKFWTEKLKDTKLCKMIRTVKKLVQETTTITSIEITPITSIEITPIEITLIEITPIEITPRLLLQYFADVLKEYLGNDYFCTNMKRLLEQKKNSRIVISDARFPNEYELIRDQQNTLSYFWRVTREQTKPIDLNTLHKSETSLLDVLEDFTIENNSSMQDLYLCIDAEMDRLNIKSNVFDIILDIRSNVILNIGIDIDGVLFDFHDSFKRYMNEIHGKSLEEMQAQPMNWNFHEEWKLDKQQFDYYYRQGILDKYVLRKGNMIDKDAVKYIRKLRRDGHKIHLVSNRNMYDVGHQAMYNTIHWLLENEIEYDTIDFDFEKGKYVKKYNLDVFVEDSPKNAKQLYNAECKKIILLDQVWNRKKAYCNYKRVLNWKEIFNEIIVLID